MDPWAFQDLVAEELRSEGYLTEARPTTNDWGVDLFASKGEERLAVQVKKYRGARLVNRQQVFELYGAARYFDCTGALLATDGELRRDAERAASKLGIRILRVDARDVEEMATDTERVFPAAPLRAPGLDFESIWRDYVMPLRGRTLISDRGLRNRNEQVPYFEVSGRPSTIRLREDA